MINDNWSSITVFPDSCGFQNREEYLPDFIGVGVKAFFSSLLHEVCLTEKSDPILGFKALLMCDGYLVRKISLGDCATGLRDVRVY